MNEVFPLRTVSQPFINYSYIIFDPRSRASLLVDPSWELGTIVNKLNELQADLKGILLTHSHYDHVNLVAQLTAIYHCDVFISVKEIEDYGFKCNNLKGVNDYEVLSFEGITVTCLHTPGHSSGSMCFLLSESIFTGDTVFIEGCGSCSSQGGSAEDMFKSIQRLKSIIAPHVRVYPGHSFGSKVGEPFNNLFNQNIYFQIDSMKQFIDFRMRPNQSNLFKFC
ncbi:MBL fold metallo-hydrolase [Paenibacillus lutrae]|uniref:MBL fold metallo-hydrolase n=1 Tax=Paenibacillus lutrae TaxID=2078573 RepID=A0A7X3FH80_9BACL|nr:MBL fold metallo-hydrolase [Paenibacillus lutrae]MVO99552.1 MBL fold metallo-hydrolase [Paenibacillus lutrae]